MPSKPPATPKKAKPEAPPDMGTFHRQLEKPEPCGEITLAEAREIKALNELLEDLNKDAVKANRVFTVAQAHRQEFMRNLLIARQLDTADVYNINDDSGIISRTATKADPSDPVLEVVAETEGTNGAEKE